MTMNKIIIIGNLGSDPEMRYTPKGAPVTSFSLATNRRYTTSEGENREETEWFRVSAWNRLAETCNNYLQKGSKVYVEGRLSSRTYVGNDGQTRVSLEVNAANLTFLDSRGNASNFESNDSFAPFSSEAPDEPANDDLPW